MQAANLTLTCYKTLRLYDSPSTIWYGAVRAVLNDSARDPYRPQSTGEEKWPLTLTVTPCSWSWCVAIGEPDAEACCDTSCSWITQLALILATLNGSVNTNFLHFLHWSFHFHFCTEFAFILYTVIVSTLWWKHIKSVYTFLKSSYHCSQMQRNNCIPKHSLHGFVLSLLTLHLHYIRTYFDSSIFQLHISHIWELFSYNGCAFVLNVLRQYILKFIMVYVNLFNLQTLISKGINFCAKQNHRSRI
jgi:hypothetical protein